MPALDGYLILREETLDQIAKSRKVHWNEVAPLVAMAKRSLRPPEIPEEQIMESDDFIVIDPKTVDMLPELQGPLFNMPLLVPHRSARSVLTTSTKQVFVVVRVK